MARRRPPPPGGDRRRDEPRDDLRGWREGNRIRSQAPRPKVQIKAPSEALGGSDVLVEWSCTAAGGCELVINSPDLAPRRLTGRLRGAMVLTGLEAGAHELVLTAIPSAHLGPRAISARRSVMIEIYVPPPSITLEVAASAQLGESVPISWRIENADQAWLTVGDAHRIIQPNGSETITPDAAGELAILIGATGEGGRAEQAARLLVTIPPLVIDAPDVIELAFDDFGILTFKVSGAAPGSIWLEALDRCRPPIPAHPWTQVEIGRVRQSECFRITAMDEGGATATHDVAVRMIQPVSVDISAELAILNRRGVPR